MRASSIYFTLVFLVAASVSASTGPVLSITERIPAVFEIPVVVPILFTGQGTDVSAAIASLDFDEDCLHFDPADSDPADGIPDSIVFVLPTPFSGSVSYDPEDTDGELDFVIADYGPPLASLPDGVIAFIILTPSCQPEQTGILSMVGFSQDPPVSFGGTGGEGIPGASLDGSVSISEPIFADGFESLDLSAWSNG
ncbi:MAG: hypothetical protein GY719_31360 [bacterium]|nr:hypothetical protein [bacterium]